MANDLIEMAQQQRLPALEIRPRLMKLVSLPPWAKERLIILKKEHQADKAGIHREVPTLPANMMISTSQRTQIEKRIAAFESFFAMTPERDPQSGLVASTVVSKLVLALAGKQGADLAGDAKGEAYMAAVEDVPCWAVEEAARRWYRGECGAEHNYVFPPGPAILREIAMLEKFRIMAVRRSLKDLASAQPRLEFSDDHCAKMRERFAGLAKVAAL
ncbi:MAG: hypothetical protein JWP25_5028 [Bradyrhizobium sp.]|nr:hypothetical protein [Bradyrhizobium sp.]